MQDPQPPYWACTVLANAVKAKLDPALKRMAQRHEGSSVPVVQTVAVHSARGLTHALLSDALRSFCDGVIERHGCTFLVSTGTKEEHDDAIELTEEHPVYVTLLPNGRETISSIAEEICEVPGVPETVMEEARKVGKSGGVVTLTAELACDDNTFPFDDTMLRNALDDANLRHVAFYGCGEHGRGLLTLWHR
jgi:hypothetical protein